MGLRNPSRPLLPINGHSVWKTDRALQYFANRPEIYADYVNLDRILRASTLNGASIAIVCDEDDWEYPLYVFSGAARGEPAYPYHHTIGRSAERVILAIGARRQLLDANPQARCVFRGTYLGLYAAK